MQCIQQLRDYIRSLGGGELSDKWKCRAQIRDYGSRAGSVDTWFTSPEGEVYRSKVAVARGLGLEAVRDPTKVKKPKAPRKPSEKKTAKANKDGDAGAGSGAAGGGGTGAGTGGAEEPWKWGGSSSTNIDLSLDEYAELLMSMPAATDPYDVYEGLLYYKEAQVRHKNKLTAAAAAAAEREELEEHAAAAAKALADADAEDALNGAGGTDDEDGNLETKAAKSKSHEGSNGGGAGHDGENGGADDKTAPMDVDKDDGGGSDEDGGSDADRTRPSTARRTTRRSLACAVAATKAALRAHLASAAARGEEDDLGITESDLEKEALEDFVPALDQWQIEMEVIRKCMVQVSTRLGRPDEDEPAPLSPTSKDAEVTDALLNLSDTEPGPDAAAAAGAGQHTGNGGDAWEEGGGKQEGGGVQEACGHWCTKRFPIDQLMANDGSPAVLHPSALFFLRYQEETAAREERAAAAAAAAAAAKREARKQEKLAAMGAAAGADGTPGAAGASDRPRLPLPKPANLSLRGKSLEEIEEALMERLSSYVSDLGGVLPSGWKVKASVRQNGANAGGVDAYYYDPYGRRHKSMIKVAEALGLEATAATKPKPLGSILGPKAKGGAAAKPEPPEATAGVTAVENPDDVADQGPNGTAAQVPQPAADEGGVATAEVAGGGAEGEGGSPGDDPNRKTCGSCRTCLNPHLKKGCLVNKAMVSWYPRVV